MLIEEHLYLLQRHLGFRTRCSLEDVPHALVDIEFRILTGCFESLIEPRIYFFYSFLYMWNTH
ncbi:MAG: hypothetical protein WBN49_09315 [Arenicellales bacterium]